MEEVLILESNERSVHWLALRNGEYVEAKRSGLIDLGPEDLLQRIDWS